MTCDLRNIRPGNAQNHPARSAGKGKTRTITRKPGNFPKTNIPVKKIEHYPNRRQTDVILRYLCHTLFEAVQSVTDGRI
jgi:hypothetical protein